METWKGLTGIIVFLVGAYAAFQGYTTVGQCNSALGQVSTFLGSLFGGSSAQMCYNAQIMEYGGIILAIIGIVIVYSAVMTKRKSGRK